jgi:hypothetical protein
MIIARVISVAVASMIRIAALVIATVFVMTSDATIVCGESRRGKRSGESDNEKKLFHGL